MDHALAGPARPRAWVFEEGQVESGAALVVAVEEVVDRRVVLVDRLLDQAQTQPARVEVHVGLRIAGDRCDVMNAFELHAPPNLPHGGRAETYPLASLKMMA